MKKFLLATLAVTVGCFSPAYAGNTLNDHNDLWEAVEKAGVDIYTNDPDACKDAWGGGFYAHLNNGAAVLMICQDNGKDANGGQVEWTANDLDTLRHEAHHVLQDCSDGKRDGDLVPLFDNAQEHYDFVTRAMTQDKINWIIRTYGDKGADKHTIIIELEAFAVAEDVDASRIANGVLEVCPAPNRFSF